SSEGGKRGGQVRQDLPYLTSQTTALSVISSPRSMIANASRNSASVMHSGGFVKNVFHRTKVYSPSCLKNLPSAAISSEVPLNGASGVFFALSRTSSKRPKRPIDRAAPTEG